MPGQNFDSKRRITVRNLRIREDIAKVSKEYFTVVLFFCHISWFLKVEHSVTTEFECGSLCLEVKVSSQLTSSLCWDFFKDTVLLKCLKLRHQQ